MDPRPIGTSANQGEPDDDALHLEAMALANELRVPLDAVRRVYEKNLSRLKSDASVGRYLVLLATRRTRDELRERGPRRAT